MIISKGNGFPPNFSTNIQLTKTVMLQDYCQAGVDLYPGRQPDGAPGAPYNFPFFFGVFCVFRGKSF